MDRAKKEKYQEVPIHYEQTPNISSLTVNLFHTQLADKKHNLSLA